MYRLSLVLIIVLIHICCFGQNSVEEMNEIKLSGQYFTGEATGNTDSEAQQFALANLMESLANYCDECECPMIKETDVTAKMKNMKMQRGDKMLVLLYVPKSIVTAMSGQSASTANVINPASSTQAPIASAQVSQPSNESLNISSYSSSTHAEVPDIIKRIGTIETYTGLDAVLNMAQSNGSVIEYGKYKSINKPDDCYLVMVNREMNVVGILSPKHNGKRTNIKDGSDVDSEGMRNFMNCMPICVRTK